MKGIGPSRRVGVLLAGVVLMFSASLGATVALPALDGTLDQTSESQRVFEAQELDGMKIYRSEGCWYCHTQQVRGTITDVALGDRLDPGDYAEQGPAMLGLERIGPDLTHVGRRYEGQVEELRRAISAPGGAAMHGYAHLSGAELDQLIAYLLALR